MSDGERSQVSQRALDALAQASGAAMEPANLSQIQASLDAVAGLDDMDLKSVEPAITFSSTGPHLGDRS